MNKLTYEQILDILEKNVNINNFASEGYVSTPEGFVFSEEVEQIKKVKNEAYNKYIQINQQSGGNRDKCQPALNEWAALPYPSVKMQEEITNSLGLGEIKQVNKYGGEGETWYAVYYFPVHNVYMRIDGYYQSYDGVSFDNEWGCASKVEPKTKTVIVYE